METTAIYEHALLEIACICAVDSPVERIALTALLDTDVFNFRDKSQLELFPEELLF